MLRSRSSPSVTFFLASVGVGAALMYYYDPQSGRRRRAVLRDQAQSAARQVEDARRIVMRDAGNRCQGFMAGAKRLVHRDPARRDDVVIAERVRAAIGREVSHPRAIEVFATEGVIELKGAVLAAEADALIECVRSVRGVRDVENRLSVHDTAEDIGSRAEFMQRSWSPAARSLAGGLGVLLALIGLLRGGAKGLLYGAIGSGLMTRAASNRDVRDVIGDGVSRLASGARNLESHVARDHMH